MPGLPVVKLLLCVPLRVDCHGNQWSGLRHLTVVYPSAV